MDIARLIRQYRKSRQLTQPELARRCGWDSQSRISMYESGKRSPSYDDLALIAEALDVPMWQFVMDQPPQDIDGYNLDIDSAPMRRLVPLISWVQAGQWSEIIDNYEPGDGEGRVPVEANVSPRSFALTVRGDSMEPEFPEGSRIVVDPDYEAHNKSYVIARLEDELEATFKQLVIDGNRCYLKPLNNRYPVIEVNDQMTICGVVREQSKRYE